MVTELNANLLPERGDNMLTSCAVAIDGCIYFMPYNARRIIKLDLNNNDAISVVGDDLGYGRDSTLERLSVLPDMCMGYLPVPNAS